MSGIEIPEQAYAAARKACGDGADTHHPLLEFIVEAAAPLIVAAEINAIIGDRDDLLWDEWAARVLGHALARREALRQGGAA